MHLPRISATAFRRTGGRRLAAVTAALVFGTLALADVAAAHHDGTANQPPLASFAMSHTTATVGTTVTFRDTSTDPDGVIVRRGWDINGDGLIGDPNGAVEVRRTYNEAGTYQILLRVVDDGGHTSQVIRPLTIVSRNAPPPQSPPPPPPNRAPVAGFSFRPAAPSVGEAVIFTSSASDPDGRVSEQLWDLDGDGQFDDAGGPMAQAAFSTPGTHIVSLEVTDDDGASTVSFQSVTVAPAVGNPAVGGSPPSGTRARRPRLLDPFPIVRIRGRVFRTVVEIDLLTVRAPRGAQVEARCSGTACPFRVTAARTQAGRRIVRFRKLERRLPPGTVIRISITKPGRIGKYVRIRIRRGEPPARSDRCLSAVGSRPIACPTP